ncbi:MAG TPA: phosphate ABC transporter substrate-binding protein [Bryobacteraceae bacterium]|nr:phosphate ABC transporter substrate-binding protein [Bryobacteraceae bacterium]
MRQLWLVGFLPLFLGLGYLAWLAAHSSSATPPERPLFGSGGPTPTGVILRLHGANTIGDQLAPPLAQAFLKARGATHISTVSTAVDELVVVGSLGGKRQAIEIKSHGSATAFLDLAAGECDIGMAVRKIHSTEVADLSSLGDMTSPAAEHVLALDGIAVIVNRKNSLSRLSVQDIARIFTGEVKNWEEVGGSGGAIKIYGRSARSGTFETFKLLALGGKPLSANAIRVEDGRQLSAKVSHDAGGIGFVALPFVLDAKALAVSESDANALMPTALTISTGDYLLSRRLYLYTAPDPKNPLAREFMDFALSAAGQAVVTAAGFIALDATIATERGRRSPSGLQVGWQRARNWFPRTSASSRESERSTPRRHLATVDGDIALFFASPAA